MSITRLFMIVSCAVLAASAPARAAAGSPKPNFVLIISDDHRWDMIGAAGNTAIHTPNLDRLASEGTYYRQGTVHVPQCSPNRACLVTGLPPHVNGHYSNQSRRKDVAHPDGFKQYPMLPKLLADAGYRTVLVGKWHLWAEPWNCGFSDVRVWMPDGAGKYHDDDQMARGNSREPVDVKGYVNDVFGKDAADFIRSDGAKEKPFLVWLALTAPHTPLTPNPPEIRNLYENKTDEQLWPPALPKDAKPRRLRDYCEAVSMADRQVGHVLAALDDAKLAENTIVIFIGDNGWMMGSRRLNDQEAYQGKVYPYEDSVRVPFIVRAPGKGAGVTDACVSSLDLPATIVKAAGMTPPQNWPGRDVLGSDEKLDHAVVEFPDARNNKFGDVDYRLIRTKTHKLIDWGDASRSDELYDLGADPQEKKNLIEDSSIAQVRDDLRAKLTEWMKRTNDPNLKSN
jgi:arylsulfatase A-like enzyme